MHYIVGRTDPCWCGSPKTAADCCLKRRRPARPGSKTGRKNRGCFAASLGDCSRRISREHYITEGVLKLFGETLSVGGMPWLEPGEKRMVPVSSLTGKILCERHNSLLAGLDQFAIRLAATVLFSSGEHIAHKNVRGNKLHLFSGDDLELWMLKVLCGVAASGNATGPHGAITCWKPPLVWLQILFEEQPFPAGCGMYFPAAGHSDSVQHSAAPIAFATIGHQDNLVGAYVVLASLRFLLAMAEVPHGLREHHIYRPSQFTFTDGERENKLFLAWSGDGGGTGIDFTVHHKSDVTANISKPAIDNDESDGATS